MKNRRKYEDKFKWSLKPLYSGLNHNNLAYLN